MTEPLSSGLAHEFQRSMLSIMKFSMKLIFHLLILIKEAAIAVVL